MKVARDFRYKFNKRAVAKACSPRTFPDLLRGTRLTKNEKARCHNGFVTINMLMELYAQYPEISWITMVVPALNPAKKLRGKTAMEEMRSGPKNSGSSQ